MLAARSRARSEGVAAVTIPPNDRALLSFDSELFAPSGVDTRVSAAMERARRVDPWLRALLEVFPTRPDQGRVAAGPTGSGHTGGGSRAGAAALRGLPIVVKGRAGLRSAQTRRLVAAGCVPVATTATPRGPGHQTWGYTDRGPTRNPWVGDRSPGGSSAGSAAAVAAGIVALGTGSDGAGSVRIPAAWCGVYGYKPSTDLAAVTGLVDPSGLTVPGPLVRDPALLGPWADAVLGPLPWAPPLQSWAWSADLGFGGALLDPDVVAIAQRAAHRLAAAAALRQIDWAGALIDPQPAWTTARDPVPSPATARSAARLRAHNNTVLAELFSAVDLLATPTTPAGPHGHDGPGEHLSVALTWGFNLSGHPALSVPAGFTRAGVPVGLHLVARPDADAALLQLVSRNCPPVPAAPDPPSSM